MDIEINNRTEAALFRNGKYEYTFTPTKKNEQIKLHHMGCNGTTKISNLQLERGTEVTFFERPYEKANSLSGIFKQLRDLDISMRDETSEFWGRLKLNNKGMLTEFKDTELNTILATTADGISTQVNKNINDAVASFNQKYNEISASVSNFENDVLKKSEINITNDGITLGAGKSINGRNLTSMLVANPENIQAITNRMIITPSYDNLVHFDKRRSFNFFDEYVQITQKIENDILKVGDRFLLKFDVAYIGALPFNFELIMKIETASNQEKSYAFQIIPNGRHISEQSLYDVTLDIDAILEEFSDVRSYTFYLRQASKTNYLRMDISNLRLMKKKSAELLVDGTIKGRHIAGETITGGNIQAGAIDSVNIKSNAITADHLKVDNAMINKLLVNDAFINNLVTKDAYIKNLKSVKISANQLETDFLRSYKGYIGGFQIGVHDKDKGSSWLTGENQFYVGMSNGKGTWGQTALWVNWGTRWDKVGPEAWYVKETGEMYCYNKARFWNTPTVYGDLQVTGEIKYLNQGSSGHWISSPQYKRIEQRSGYAYIYYSSYGYDWFELNKEISDRRYKRNIKESEVNALEVLNKLNTYSYTKEYNGEVKDISCGIMAQEVEEHLPDAFKQLPDDIKSYGAFELVPYLVKGIQELSKKNEKLEKEMEILKHGK
jgi:hypothetical protein